MAKSKKRKTPEIDLPDEAFEDRNIKIRVNTFLDLDVVKALKAEAERTGSKYQTLLNQRLRDSIFGRKADPELRETIREVVREEMLKKAV
jgi:uncharacterized protein (DUF4415 family)